MQLSRSISNIKWRPNIQNLTLSVLACIRCVCVCVCVCDGCREDTHLAWCVCIRWSYHSKFYHLFVSLLKRTRKIGKPDERFSPITPERYVLATWNRPPSHIIRPRAFQRYQPRVCATYRSRDTAKIKFFSAISPERKLVQTNRRHRWKARPRIRGGRSWFHLSTTFLSKVIPHRTTSDSVRYTPFTL